MCQRGQWALKEVSYEISHQMKREMSASENGGPKSGVYYVSCANVDAESRMGVDTERCTNENAEP